MSLSHNITEIPALGFGTYGMQGRVLTDILPQAIQRGFRHIDTAQIYHNEAEVGDTIARSGINRTEFFITTKVWVDNYSAAAFIPSVEASLAKLRTDYIDLLLLHWPSNRVPLATQISLLNDCVRSGKVKAIGVSNFNISLMKQAVELSEIPLLTNQFEYHPYLNQALLIEEARRAGLLTTAYCSMAVGRVFSEPLLLDLAASYNKTVAQIVLRWLLQQQQVVALTRTTNAKHLSQSSDIFDFSLTDEQMLAIHHLADAQGRIVSPPGLSPLWDATPALSAK